MENREIELPVQFFLKLLIRYDILETSYVKKIKAKYSKAKFLNLEEVLKYLKEEIKIEENSQKRLNNFFKYIKDRIEGIILCFLLIKRKRIKLPELERVLITHRAIYLLKNKSLSIEDILIIKGIITQEEKEELIKKIKEISEKERKKLIKDALKELEKEENEAARWREQHKRGIIGVKYIQTQQLKDEVKKEQQEKQEKIQEKQENKQEEQENKQEIIKKQEKVQDKPQKQENKQEIIKQEEKIQEKQESDQNIPYLDEELEEIFSKKERQTSNKIVFLVGIIGLIIFLFIILTSKSKEIKLYEELEKLWLNKEYVQLKDKAEKFLKQYPTTKNKKIIKNWLYKIKLIEADISYRQGKLEKSYKILNDLKKQNIKDKNIKKEIEELIKNIEKDRNLKERLQQFNQEIKKIKNLIYNLNKFNQAQKYIKYLEKNKENYKELHVNIENIIEKLKQELEIHKKEYVYSKVKYYKIEELKKILKYYNESKGINFNNTFPKNYIGIIPLHGKEKLEKIIDTKGNFFPYIKGYLYSINIETTKINWIENLGENNPKFNPIFIGGPKQYLNISFTDKILVVSLINNSLKLLNKNTGDIIWEKVIPGVIETQPIIYKGKVYISCLDNICYVIDLFTGKIKGGYFLISTPLFEPTIDKRKKIIFITTKKYIHGFNLNNGKLLYNIPTPNNLLSKILVIYPYIFLFQKTQDKNTKLIVYNLQRDKIIQSFTLNGIIYTKPKLAAGMIAVLTDTNLYLFGINLIDFKKPLFRLTGIEGISLKGKGKGYIEFTNFFKNIIVLQKDLYIYKIKHFSNEDNILELKKVYKLNQKENKILISFQKYNEYYLYNYYDKDKDIYNLICFKINKYTNKITKIWEKYITPKITNIIKTSEDRVLLFSKNSDVYEIFINKDKIYFNILSKLKFEPKENIITYIPEDEGKIILVDKKDKMHLIDSITGWEEILKYDNKNIDKIYSIKYHQGNIFLGTSSEVIGISLKTGKKSYIEFSEFHGRPFSSNHLIYGDTIIIGCDNGKIYKLNIKNVKPLPYLEKIWEFKTNGEIKNTLVLEKNILYFGSNDGYVYSIDLNNQELKWKFKTNNAIITKPLIFKDKVYIGSLDRNFYILDKFTGKLIKKQKFLGKLVTNPILKNNKIYIVSIAGDLKIFNLNGEIINTIKLGSYVTQNPFIIKDYIFIYSNNGFLYVFKE